MLTPYPAQGEGASSAAADGRIGQRAAAGTQFTTQIITGTQFTTQITDGRIGQRAATGTQFTTQITCCTSTTVQILTRKALLGAGRLCAQPPLLHLAVDCARRGRRRYSFLLVLLVPKYKS